MYYVNGRYNYVNGRYNNDDDMDDDDVMSEEDLFEEAFENSSTNIEEVPAQCGMRMLVDLDDEDTLEMQIRHLENAFMDSDNGGSSGASQVLLTDVYSSERTVWAETKAHSYHGPTTPNPNTGNGIKVYICTRATLKELKALVKKKTKNKKK